MYEWNFQYVWQYRPLFANGLMVTVGYSLLCIVFGLSVAAVLALSLYGGAFYSEIIRGGMVSIDPGQSDAARDVHRHFVACEQTGAPT